jgi:hypothetical protein
MKEKVSFTIDKDLIGWFRLHIKDEHTTMSALINHYILNLKREREGRPTPKNVLHSSN